MEILQRIQTGPKCDQLKETTCHTAVITLNIEKSPPRMDTKTLSAIKYLLTVMKPLFYTTNRHAHCRAIINPQTTLDLVNHLAY